MFLALELCTQLALYNTFIVIMRHTESKISQSACTSCAGQNRNRTELLLLKQLEEFEVEGIAGLIRTKGSA